MPYKYQHFPNSKNLLGAVWSELFDTLSASFGAIALIKDFNSTCDFASASLICVISASKCVSSAIILA